MRFFFWPDVIAERGVALLTFLKRYLGDTDSKYIYGVVDIATDVQVFYLWHTGVGTLTWNGGGEDTFTGFTLK